MTSDFVIGLGRQTIEVTLMLAAPALGFGLVAGLIIAVFQAVTQIHDMTLTFVPKIVMTFLAILIFGSWMMDTLVTYISNILINMAEIIR